MVPSINVNIRATHAHPNKGDVRFHDSDCAPILIPCPIPRSVTFSVVLGCTCGGTIWRGTPAAMLHRSDYCPAIPVRVACSIGGKTWEDSEVSDFEMLPSHEDPSDAVKEACRVRWALVKALVLGKESAAQINHAGLALFKQRDTVFAALADMAREEAALIASRDRLPVGLQGPAPFDVWDRPSVESLSRYVDELIGRVGVLS